MVRILAGLGFSNPSLKSQIIEARDRGAQFSLPINRILGGLKKQEDRLLASH